VDEARAIQLQIWRTWSPERRVAAGTALAATGWHLRERRLRERFPAADDRELGWARVRLSLGLPLATTPP